MRALAEGVWESTQTLRLLGVQLPRRMTVVRLPDGGLWVHSANRLDAERRRALDALGPLRHVVAPNCFHHFFLEDYAAAYPEARFWAAPGLAEKRADFPFHELLSGTAPPAWEGELDQVLAEGVPKVNEVLFLHRPSKTLLLTDLVFNVGGALPAWSRLFFRLNGCYQRFGPSRLFRSFVKDRRAVGRTVERVLEWDFERVVMAHGDVLEDDPRGRLRAAFAGW